MKNTLMISAVMILLVGCGKSVDKNAPNPPTAGPTGSPGVVDNTPLPAPAGTSGVYQLTFANSGYDYGYVDQTNSYQMSAHMQVNFQSVLPFVSFVPQQQPVSRISVYRNGDFVCEYVLNVSWGYSRGSCVANLEIFPGDRIYLRGLPVGETAKLKFNYQTF